jgi:uncharacterized damage-inducible protein DinB
MMNSFHVATIVAALALPAVVQAQKADNVRDEIMMHFENSMEKFIALAEAMPADKFTWAPGKGVMPVGQVYMHVARYNYGYPSENMGVPAPQGVNLQTMEVVRDKAAVLQALRQSTEYVRSNVKKMDGTELARQTKLYGRDVQEWSVLLQLVSHMNEHLGQSIAYARMNNVVPPWSR